MNVSSLKTLGTQQLKLRFFDVDVNLHSDSKTYIDIFARMYPRFQINGTSTSVNKSVEYAILSSPDNPWGKPVIILDEKVLPLDNPKLLEGYIYETILYDIIARVRSHLLIHAGAVSYKGQAVIIVADAMHGKTTTVLELVRRGFKFLSDEMAALGRIDQRVYPFPRSLRIRSGTLERVGAAGAATDAPVWLNKLILDIENIKPESMGQASPISHIFILQNPSEEEKTDSNREIGVYVDRLDDELITAISQIEGIVEVHPETNNDYGFPMLRLKIASRFSVITKIKAVCHQQQILIVDILKLGVPLPTFNHPPHLKKIPQSKAAMYLLRQFQGGYQSDLLQNEFDGNSTQLFMELATLISPANCYTLSVGHLNKMADLICNLVGYRE